jgi:hypothetical protein
MTAYLEVARRTLAGLQPKATTIRCPWCFGTTLTERTDGLWCGNCEQLAWVSYCGGRITRADQSQEDAIDPPDPCGACGSLLLWQTLAERWRCQLCDPPARSRRLADLAKRLRGRRVADPNSNRGDPQLSSDTEF